MEPNDPLAAMAGARPFAQLVSEADIDWILCLELNADAAFRSWLGEKIFGFDPIHIDAWRSVSDSMLGESDLVWLVYDATRARSLALIENKINAVAQPEQHERYLLRGQQYRNEGHCIHFKIALISPQAYRSADSGNYEVSVSYEAIRDWFAAIGSERSAHLARVFGAALSKPARKPPNPEITAFRRLVWELARAEFPALGIVEPAPTREYWVCKSYGDFAIKYKMLTKGGRFHASYVDLELPGKAAAVDSLRSEYGAGLRSIGAVLVPAYKSAAMRIEVPCASPPVFVPSITREALRAWSLLLEWWRANRAQRND